MVAWPSARCARAPSYITSELFVLLMQFPSLLFCGWRSSNRPGIILCHGCRGNDICCHMMASQGDQEVVLWRPKVGVGGGVVVCAASFRDLCGRRNDITFNSDKLASANGGGGCFFVSEPSRPRCLLGACDLRTSAFLLFPFRVAGAQTTWPASVCALKPFLK